jgi:hypothetical protein
MDDYVMTTFGKQWMAQAAGEQPNVPVMRPPPP